jgi:hypothetical protein
LRLEQGFAVQFGNFKRRLTEKGYHVSGLFYSRLTPPG